MKKIIRNLADMDALPGVMITTAPISIGLFITMLAPMLDSQIPVVIGGIISVMGLILWMCLGKLFKWSGTEEKKQ